ncbi:MAG: glycosyltransferase, partial [Planctomycetes bacterium]|nr:glycosyltransferase [Planctomycetota bacterium]
MKVAVITPYYDEPIEWLRKCHYSVAAQDMCCTHIMIADGRPRKEVDQWAVRHIPMPYSHNDFGDTARSIGVTDAIGAHFDAIAFLDADNWFAPNHISSLMQCAQKTGAAIVSSGRLFCRMDTSVMGQCLNSDGDNFSDTNCLLFTKSAFRQANEWVYVPPYAHGIGDRVLW